MTESYSDLCRMVQRGWPWPEASFGCSPVFGDDGWCRACGMPFHDQTGNLILERRGLSAPLASAWVPYGFTDSLLMSQELAFEVRERFDVELREVFFPRGASSGIWQALPCVTAEPWWPDTEALAEALRVRHDGSSGVTCSQCGRWRWEPANLGWLPPVSRAALAEGRALVTGPEWFGSGWNNFRMMVMDSELAGWLVALGGARSYESRPIMLTTE